MWRLGRTCETRLSCFLPATVKVSELVACLVQKGTFCCVIVVATTTKQTAGSRAPQPQTFQPRNNTAVLIHKKQKYRITYVPHTPYTPTFLLAAPVPSPRFLSPTRSDATPPPMNAAELPLPLFRKVLVAVVEIPRAKADDRRGSVKARDRNSTRNILFPQLFVCLHCGAGRDAIASQECTEVSWIDIQ